jgi:hypothetical protein
MYGLPKFRDPGAGLGWGTNPCEAQHTEVMNMLGGSREPEAVSTGQLGRRRPWLQALFAHPLSAFLFVTLFDAAHYRAAYGFKGASPRQCRRHYRREGWQRGHDPNPWFSGSGYLRTHPDVAVAGMEPFDHFIGAGRFEGRHLRQEMAPSPGATGRWFGDKARRLLEAELLREPHRG